MLLLLLIELESCVSCFKWLAGIIVFLFSRAQLLTQFVISIRLRHKRRTSSRISVCNLPPDAIRKFVMMSVTANATFSYLFAFFLLKKFLTYAPKNSSLLQLKNQWKFD